MTTPRWRSSSWSDPVAGGAQDGRHRIALCLQYDGGPFCGWQRQRGQASVQATLEQALEALDPHRPIRAIAAGRTDRGVHAAGQVVHVDTSGPIPPQRWPAALNGRLPASIRVRAAATVHHGWHACFSAIYRRYRYTLYNGRRPNLFLAPWSWHRYRHRLDERAMAEALGGLLGRHDFRAFRRAGSHRAHSSTQVQAVSLERCGDLIVTEIQASGFLYGMVRLLMGQLVAVGEGRLNRDAFTHRWRSGAREEIREAAPPQGLCLLRVGYPSPVFPSSAWYDGQPRFQLECQDPPEQPDRSTPGFFGAHEHWPPGPPGGPLEG